MNEDATNNHGIFVLIVLLNHLEKKSRKENILLCVQCRERERARNHNDNHSQKFTMPLSDMN